MLLPGRGFVNSPGTSDPRRLARLALIASLALHALGLVGLRCSAPAERAPRRPEFAIDIESAPPPPRAEALPPEEERPAAATPPAPPPADVAVPAPPPPAVAGLGLDAGVDAPEEIDAGRRRIARIDAGLDAAEEVAVADAGVGDGGEVLAAADGGIDDGGAVLAAADGGIDDGGAALATGPLGDGGAVATAGGVPSDGGTGDGGLVAAGGADPSGAPAAKPSAGTAADLRTYFPEGHVVSVLIRLDRLRDTEWSPLVDAIFAPMPDYRSLVGGADVKLADTFETLAISTPAPRDAVATTLVVRARVGAPALRELLDADDAPVAWSAVVGGALGRRGRSPRVFAGDRRVFLQWRAGWTTLAQPADLGGLLAPRAGDLDADAPADRLPPWLARVGAIEDESGHPTGPALMATAAGFFPAEIPLPVGGATLPGPDRATITLEIDPQGFLVRGNVRFADDSAAATAADTIARVRVELLADRWTKIGLGRAGALNALKGLSIQRTGRRLAFATSVSIADARVLLTLVANLVNNYFVALQE